MTCLSFDILILTLNFCFFNFKMAKKVLSSFLLFLSALCHDLSEKGVTFVLLSSKFRLG